MKTDALFYYLFQEFPSIFFELIGQSASLADDYQFTSIQLKQVAFRLDGLLLPPPDKPNLPIYFVEVQFQLDETFYYRLFTEIFLYLYQYKVVNNWQAIVVYPRRSVESQQPVPYQFLLGSDRRPQSIFRRTRSNSISWCRNCPVSSRKQQTRSSKRYKPNFASKATSNR